MTAGERRPFPVHPLADLLPGMLADEIEPLVRDAEAHGQRELATLWWNSPVTFVVSRGPEIQRASLGSTVAADRRSPPASW